ncbi:serpin B13 [Camelus ferus]|nr:serpin B13 [Camelus ferus]
MSSVTRGRNYRGQQFAAGAAPGDATTRSMTTDLSGISMDLQGPANTCFGFDLFKELSEKRGDNIFFSPAGISAAIGMLLLGTRGATAAQLEKIEKTEEIHHQFQRFLNEISKLTNDYELKVANRLFGEKTYLFLQSTSKSVLMMTQHQSFSFMILEDLQAKILGIPYKNNDLSMFVLLPDDIDGLEKIIDKITPSELIEWTSPGHMEERTVNLHLPRFEVEDSYDMEAVLAAVGMADAFNEQQADSSGMSSPSGLHAQKFLHRSFVEVSEEGTEAAAATGISFAMTSAPDYEKFHCNHPFLFFIRHNEADSVLFFGRFSSP